MANKSDLRVLKTRKNIQNTFINLLLVKDFKDITVQNIIEEALIGRSTFYDHYFNKYDLLKQMVDEILDDFNIFIQKRFVLKSYEDFSKFFSSMIKYYSKQRNELLALLKVHTESVDLYNSLFNILKDSCSYYLDTIEIKNNPNIPKEYLCQIYASTAITSLRWYIENNDDYTSESFMEIFNSLCTKIIKLLLLMF